MIARRLAVDHPSRVDRLVLCSCTDRFTPYLRQMTGLLVSVLRKLPAESFARTIELLGSAPQFFDAVLQRIRDGRDPAIAARDERMVWVARGMKWADDVLVFQ